MRHAHCATRLSRLRIQNTNPVLSFYAQLLQRVGDVCTVHTSIQPSIQAQWKERLRVVTTVHKSSVERTTSFPMNLLYLLLVCDFFSFLHHTVANRFFQCSCVVSTFPRCSTFFLFRSLLLHIPVSCLCYANTRGAAYEQARGGYALPSNSCFCSCYIAAATSAT